MSHEFESGFVTLTPAWHGLATVLPENVSRENVLELAGLDWQVEERPLFDADGSVVPRFKQLRRSSDDAFLSVVGSGYEPIQHDRAADFACELAGIIGGQPFDTAMSLRGGRIICFNLIVSILGLPGGEVVRRLLVADSHDGSLALTAKFIEERTVCKNTLTMGLAEDSPTVKVRHTRNFESRIGEARRILQLEETYALNVKTRAEKMYAEMFSESDWRELVDKLVPKPEEEGRGATLAENARETLSSIYFGSTNLEDIRGTQWGAYNAVVEYFDHHTNRRSTQTGSAAENRAWSILFGGENIGNKALALLAD